MKSRKLLVVYIVLLACVLIAMFRLWPYKQEPVPPRDYPEIKSEGILRLVTEYNQSGYYVAGHLRFIRTGSTDSAGDEPGRKFQTIIQ